MRRFNILFPDGRREVVTAEKYWTEAESGATHFSVKEQEVVATILLPQAGTLIIDRGEATEDQQGA